jgi:hypothetical protein
MTAAASPPAAEAKGPEGAEAAKAEDTAEPEGLEAMAEEEADAARAAVRGARSRAAGLTTCAWPPWAEIAAAT